MTKRLLCGLLLLALFASHAGASSSATQRRPGIDVGGLLLQESSRALVMEAADGRGGLVLCHPRLRRVTRLDVDSVGALLSLRGTWLIAYGTDCLGGVGVEQCPVSVQVASGEGWHIAPAQHAVAVPNSLDQASFNVLAGSSRTNSRRQTAQRRP